MDRVNLDGLITFVLVLGDRIEDVKTSIYSSEAIEDEDQVLQRLMAMQSLMDRINAVVRSLDEANLSAEEILKRSLGEAE